MPWKDKLQPASFRGVPFEVESDGMEAGRRTQVHEYPKRDKPYAEDLGRATRKVTLTAFVIGPEYMAARDKLLGALEEEGPGTLVHPWYGSLQVSVESVQVRHHRADGGYCSFDLGFVEAGELTFPTASSSTAGQVRMAADDLSTASLGDFASVFNVGGLPDFVADGALAELTSVLGTVQDGLRFVSPDIGGLTGAVLGELTSLVSVPSMLGSRLLGLFDGLVSFEDTPSRQGQVFRALLNTRQSPSLAATPVSGATPSRLAQARNTAAVRALVRQLLLVQAAGTASLMPLPVYDDAIRQRNRLTADLEAESLTASDTLFPALTDLRVKVWRDMTARSRDSARLGTVTPAEVMPAVALAYDLYEEAGRDEEIVARNRIAHPGFLPVRPLQVLSR